MTTPGSTTVAQSSGEGVQGDTRPPALDDWHSSAPKRVVSAYEEGDQGVAWRAWADYLQRRKKPAPVHNLLKTKQPPLLWSLPAEPPNGQTKRLIKLLDKLDQHRTSSVPEAVELLSPWLDESVDAEIDVAHALQCVAWARSLDRLAQYCAADLWWELVDYLSRVAIDARSLDAELQPLAANLLTGELPLTLAYLLPERKSCRRLAKAASALLSQALNALLDGQGMPHARQLHLLRPLLGCWTRCGPLLKKTQKAGWSDDAETQYAWLVTQALRTSRPDGSALLSADKAEAFSRELIDAAIDMGGDETDEELADYSLPGRSLANEAETEWPTPAYESDWSELAVLRSDWSPTSPRLLVTYADRTTNIELCSAERTLLSGEWTLELSVADRAQALDAEANWEAVAWESDNDVDYIELEMNVTPELRVQRSLLLAREDQFLMMADTVLGEDPRPLHYRSQLPLGVGTAAECAGETREIHLQSGKLCSRVLPLALPEWRADPRGGSLEASDGALVLDLTGNQSLFAPLFLDLAPRRHKKPLTWRQLSVGEHRKNVPRHEAAGYRVQIGKAQWLIYRSLTPAANRTLLGQNLMCELHVSRFLTNGDVEELIEIE